MKETFERLYQKNLKAFILTFKKEPSEKDLEAIRTITHLQVAFIGAVILQKDTDKFINYYQNV